MIWVIALCAVILAASAILVLIRIERGPSMLDRMVGVDVMTAILLGALALLAAVTRRSDLLAVFIVVSVVGFVGSVSLARVARHEDPGTRRILTPDEEQVEEAHEVDEELDLAAHDVDGVELPGAFGINTALWDEDAAVHRRDVEES